MGSSTGCPLQTSLRGSPDSTQVVFSWPPLFVNTLEQLTELRKAWDLREWVYVKGHRWARWGGGSYMQGLCLLPFLLTKQEAWVSIQNFYWALITWAWLRKPLVTWLNPISSPTPLPNGQGVQGPNPLITELFFLVTSSHPEPLQGPTRVTPLVQQRHSVTQEISRDFRS